MIGWAVAAIDVVLAVLFGMVVLAFVTDERNRDAAGLAIAGIFAVAAVALFIQGVVAA